MSNANPPAEEMLACALRGFEAFPADDYWSALKGRAPFPVKPACPFRRADRARAWHRGYQHAWETMMQTVFPANAAD